MKKLFLFTVLAFSFSVNSYAEEAPSEEPAQAEPSHFKVTSIQSWGLGVSSFQWNESLKLQQGAVSVTDYANYNGLTLTAQKEVTYLRWGWALGAFVGSGQAVGGGNSTTVSYQKDKVGFTIYGIAPRVFYRLSNRANIGLSALAFMKNIDWPTETGITVDSGQKSNSSALADINLRIFRNWDFYTGIGPLAEGATLWKVGINYRF